MADVRAPSRPPARRSRPRLTGVALVFGALAVAAIGAFLVFAFAVSPGDDDATTIANEGLIGAPTVTSIIERPEEYLGEEVTVWGRVQGVFGPRTFTITGDDAEGGGELLIVSAGEVPGTGGRPADAISDSFAAEVTGEVRAFDEDVVEEVGAPDLADALPQWQGRPIVVARSINLIAGPAEGPTAAAGDLGPVVDPDTLIREFDRYRGETVTVEGPVNQVLGGNGFVVGESEVLIVAAQATVPDTLRAGQQVRVTGTAQRFDVGLYEDRLGLDLDWDRYRRFAGRPAIIATAVEPVR